MEKRTFKCEGERNDYMLYYEQVFTVFEMIFQKHTKYKLTVWKFIVRSYDKNDMKEKVNDLVRLHKAMQEGNARTIKNSIIFRRNSNSYLGTW